MFRTRLISGIVLVILALLVLILGGPLLAAVLFAVSMIGMYELYRALKIAFPFTVAGWGACLCCYLLVIFNQEEYLTAVLLALLIVCMSIYVFRYPRYQTAQVSGTILGFVYVAMMLSCIYELRILEDGAFLVWLIFLSSWGCDTCAYCVGMLIGKHKMAPNLSPKKSIEGAVGGVVGAGLLGVLYALAAAGHMSGIKNPVPLFALICVAGALISMVGDLAASAIKRNCGLKDFGKLIPGHGGILDRFDSVIFVAPVIYYLTRIFMSAGLWC